MQKDEELSYVHAKCYSTTLSLRLHRELYIPVFHFISYKYGRILENHYSYWSSLLFNIKQAKQKKQKRYSLMTESLLSNNTSNRSKFIMTPTRGINCGLGHRYGTIILSSGKLRTVDNMLL